jgi:hypothetical protein
MAFHNAKVFISHASENKEAIAKNLANLLAKSVNVWFDEYSIEPGGSIFNSINHGMAECNFGVVILSKEFFAKKWTKAELAGLFGREDFGTKIIPVWHEVSHEEVSEFSPILADRKAIKSDEGVQAVTEFILRGIRSVDGNDSFVYTGTIETLFSSLEHTASVASEKEALYCSEKGASKVFQSQAEFFELAVKRIAEIALAKPLLKLSWSKGEFQCIPNDKIYLNIDTPGNQMLRFEGTRPSKVAIEIARINVTISKLIYDDFGMNKSAEPIERHTFSPKFDDQLTVMWKEEGSGLKSNRDLIDFGLARLHEHMATWLQQRYRE